MLGLAAGDALGTTLEFKPQGTFTPIDDIVGGGPFHLEPGQWTDETSMALCLAASLVETGGFDPVDQLERYLRWLRQGYMSSAGASFDVGRDRTEVVRKPRDERCARRNRRPEHETQDDLAEDRLEEIDERAP